MVRRKEGKYGRKGKKDNYISIINNNNNNKLFQ